MRGTHLTSRAVADGVCANTFGAGWRMAEFHDGRYGANLENSGGWSYWAYGDVPAGTRFWTAINDQPPTPGTDPRPLPPPPPHGMRPGPDLLTADRARSTVRSIPVVGSRW
ncbi:hypothetical protein ACFQ2B_30855 [Streptomyces stramineus]